MNVTYRIILVIKRNEGRWPFYRWVSKENERESLQPTWGWVRDGRKKEREERTDLKVRKWQKQSGLDMALNIYSLLTDSPLFPFTIPSSLFTSIIIKPFHVFGLHLFSFFGSLKISPDIRDELRDKTAHLIRKDGKKGRKETSTFFCLFSPPLHFPLFIFLFLIFFLTSFLSMTAVMNSLYINIHRV